MQTFILQYARGLRQKEVEGLGRWAEGDERILGVTEEELLE